MKRFVLVLLGCVLSLVVGCGGGGAHSTLSNTALIGHWLGASSSNSSNQGTLNFSVADNGTVSGTYTQTGQSPETISGTFRSSGDFTITAVTASNTTTVTGHSSIGSNGDLIGSGTATTSGVTVSFTFDLSRQTM